MAIRTTSIGDGSCARLPRAPCQDPATSALEDAYRSRALRMAAIADSFYSWLGVRDDIRLWSPFRMPRRPLPSGSENVKVVADHHSSTIDVTDFLQQHLLRIWLAYPARVRTVIQNQQTGRRFLRDLRHLT